MQLHTFLISAPETIERSSTHHMEAVGIQIHTFLISIPDNFEGPEAFLMDFLEL